MSIGKDGFYPQFEAIVKKLFANAKVLELQNKVDELETGAALRSLFDEVKAAIVLQELNEVVAAYNKNVDDYNELVDLHIKVCTSNCELGAALAEALDHADVLSEELNAQRIETDTYKVLYCSALDHRDRLRQRINELETQLHSKKGEANAINRQLDYWLESYEDLKRNRYNPFYFG